MTTYLSLNRRHTPSTPLQQSYSGSLLIVEFMVMNKRTNSTNISTESWKWYHPRCAPVDRQNKIPRTFYRHARTIRHCEKRNGHYQQHSRRSFMDPWMPTEDHKIRSGNWTSSVKANEKKKDHYRIVSSSVKFYWRWQRLVDMYYVTFVQMTKDGIDN
jgi:hypothetical protein